MRLLFEQIFQYSYLLFTNFTQPETYARQNWPNAPLRKKDDFTALMEAGLVYISGRSDPEAGISKFIKKSFKYFFLKVTAATFITNS